MRASLAVWDDRATSSARLDFAPGRALAIAVLAVAAQSLVAGAPAAARIPSARADRIAQRVLKPGSTAVLYRARRIFGPRATVQDAGIAGRPRSSALSGNAGTRAVVTPLSRRRIGRRAYLYWLDRAPAVLRSHPSTLLLLSARKGRVLRRSSLAWGPLVGRRVPKLVRVSGRSRPRSAVATQAQAAASSFEKSCVVAGGDFGEPLTGINFRYMQRFAELTVGSSRYRTFITLPQLRTALTELYDQGCRDVLTYMTGNQGGGAIEGLIRRVRGQPPLGPYVSRGSISFPKPGGRYVVKTAVFRAEDVAAVLEEVRGQRPDLGISLIVEACHGGNWIPRVPAAAADRIVTSVGPEQFSLGPRGDGRPSPFLDVFLNRVGLRASAAPGTSFGQAVDATVKDIQADVEVRGKVLERGKFPQDVNYRTPTATSQTPSLTGCENGRPAGGVTLTMVGDSYMNNRGMGWAAGKVTATPSDGSPEQTGEVGYTSTSVLHLGPYPCGTRIAFRPEATMGNHFERWAMPAGIPDCPAPNCTVTLSPTGGGANSRSIELHFGITVHLLTVTSPTPAGGVVTSFGNTNAFGSTIRCGEYHNGPSTSVYKDCQAAVRAPQREGEYITLRAQPNRTAPEGTNYKVGSWNGCDVVLFAGSNASCQIFMVADRTTTVNWVPDT